MDINKIFKQSDVMMAVGIIAIVVIMIVTLSPFILSSLIAINFAISLLILLVSIYIKEPLDFSVFPGMLLVVTLYRLSLNISSTKLILGIGDAGKVIRFFGDVVTQGNIVVGFIVFMILIIVQFIVITKGAGRVAEVAARFTLDAMPGKQMSIDADLNAGLIDDAEAKARREKISREADFYGAMDGASKFVRGDAIAGIIITAINIVGGIILGFSRGEFQNGGWQNIFRTYTVITIGDGLSAQIPALLVAIASGFVVTRASGNQNIGEELSAQLLKYPKVLLYSAIAFIMLGLISFFSILPTIPFMVIGIILGTIYYFKMKVDKEQLTSKEIDNEKGEVSGTEGDESGKDTGEKIEELLQVDALKLEIGYGLVSFVSGDQGSELANRINVIRRQIAMEIGIIVPLIRIQDNIQLPPNTYSIKIKGVEVANGIVYPGKYLAMNPGTAEKEIDGVKVTEPAFGLPAVWIAENKKIDAEMIGYTVVEAIAVIATHLTEVIKSNSSELLGRQETQSLIDTVKEKYPALVDEVVPGILNVGLIQKVLQGLLDERVSIRDMVTILETLGDYGTKTKNVEILIEYVRRGLSRSIIQNFVDDGKNLYVVTLGPNIEKKLKEALRQSEFGSVIAVHPNVVQQIINNMSNLVAKYGNLEVQPVMLVAPEIRKGFRNLIEGTFAYFPVLSYNEIPKGINLKSIGMVSGNES